MTLVFDRAGTRLTLYIVPAEENGHISNSVSMYAEREGGRDEDIEREAAARMTKILPAKAIKERGINPRVKNLNGPPGAELTGESGLAPANRGQGR
jgi:hypothetical protein